MLFFFMVGLTNYWGTSCPNYTPYFNLIVQYWIVAISWSNGLDLYYYVYNNIFILLFFIFVQGPCVCIYIYINFFLIWSRIWAIWKKLIWPISLTHMEKYSYRFVIVAPIWKNIRTHLLLCSVYISFEKHYFS